MEISQIFNKERYFLRFNGLRYQFLLKTENKSIDAYKESTHHFSLATEIMFFAKNAYRILEQMKTLNDASILQFRELKRSLSLKCKRFILQSSIVDEYLSLLMPFLNTMYILQDRIMPTIANANNISLKPRNKENGETDKQYQKYKNKFENSLTSFYNFATNKKNLLSRFSPEIKGIVKEYWSRNGELIRKYRNIEQHIFNLVTHSYFQLNPEEKLIIVLPDNPKAQPQNFKYSKIYVYEFFKIAFREFNFFVEKLAKVLKFEEQMYTLEGTDLYRINLEKAQDYSTVCVAISNNNGIEFCKGSGFPSQLTIKPIKIDKNIQITKKY